MLEEDDKSISSRPDYEARLEDCDTDNNVDVLIDKIVEDLAADEDEVLQATFLIGESFTNQFFQCMLGMMLLTIYLKNF